MRTVTLDGTDAGDTPSRSASDGGSGPALSPAQRYVPVRLIARGGMGEVWEYTDAQLRRPVARKVMLPRLSTGARERFLREAVLTARLNHPGVIPILDQGETDDGRPYYDMPLMRWKTLDERVYGPPPDDWQVRDRVDLMRKICEIVGYAHTQHGVVHRDLKPSNVLIGDHSEVIVLDWGIAKELGAAEPVGWELDDPGTARGPETRLGQGMGTPGYRPPEQAKGMHHLLGPTADVYALGATLWAILVLDRPPDTPARPDCRLLPEGIDAICDQAMALRPSARFATAAEMAAALKDWLDGVYRRDRALGLVAQAAGLDTPIREHEERAEALRVEARRHLVQIPPHESIDKKLPWWRVEDAAREAARASAVLAARRIQLLHGALAHVPDLPEAHARLADYHQAAHAAAEAVGDVAGVALHEQAVRTHDLAGRHRAYLDGYGLVTVHSDPPGAEVLWDTYVEEGRRLVPRPQGSLGMTPVVRARLPHGSHRLRLRLAGHAEVVYPVAIDRAGTWDGVAPGDRRPTPIRLPRVGELGPDDVYVPAGWFRSGGDPAAPDGLPGRRLWLDGFVIRRHPVTVAEWFRFLNRLVEAGREEEALRCAPSSGVHVGWERDATGGFRCGGRPFDEDWEADWPIRLVDWHAATLFAAAEAERTGVPWRLPHDQEREKATRGVDGRAFAWGSFFDPTWANVLHSRPGRKLPAGVGGHPLDVSPYGVEGTCGNVRDWCNNPYVADGPPPASRVTADATGEPGEYRFARGGQYEAAADYSRAAGRFASIPGRRSSLVSVRLVAPITWPA